MYSAHKSLLLVVLFHSIQHSTLSEFLIGAYHVEAAVLVWADYVTVSKMCILSYTVELLYCGHHWDRSKSIMIPYFRVA